MSTFCLALFTLEPAPRPGCSPDKQRRRPPVILVASDTDRLLVDPLKQHFQCRRILTDHDTLKRLRARLIPPLSAGVVAFKSPFPGREYRDGKHGARIAHPAEFTITFYSPTVTHILVAAASLGPSSLKPGPPRGPLGNAEGHRQVLPISVRFLTWPNR